MAMAGLDLNSAHWHKSSYSNQAGGDCVEVAGLNLNRAAWRTSSHSNQEGGNCVEVAGLDLDNAAWRTSSHSNQAGGNCVEVGNMARVVPVRDSKYPNGPVLIFPAASWTAFVDELTTGRSL
ncbi:hypothetical protein GCM10009579_86050 [Streptomyces javensis]|uniref:DUF397 domain-containing protein n=2 Tax=Streptomyces javensis TaxID=114698 RepID=A0ABN1XH47_9ACTN